MASVLLLTERYPFATGEEFLDSELPLLSEEFVVVVLPTSPISGASVRPLPATARLERPDIRCRNRLQLLAHGCWSLRRLIPHLSIDDLRSCLRHPGRIKQLVALASRVADVSRQIRVALAAQPIDLVYTYWFDAGTVAALLERGQSPLPIVTRAHGFDLYPERQGGWIPLRCWAMVEVDQVFTVSEHGRRRLTHDFPQAAGKITVSRLGTADHGLAAAETVSAGIHVVSLSSLVPVKRIDLLIDALAVLREQTTVPIQWTHIGDGPLRDELQRLAEQRLSGVRWGFAGHLDHGEALNSLKNTSPSFLASTSDSEGLPVSMMEAMSLGVPVIAPPVGGVPEIVLDGLTGFLTPPEPTAAEVASAMMRWARLPDNDKRIMRATARRFWETHFFAENRTGEFIQNLQRVSRT